MNKFRPIRRMKCEVYFRLPAAELSNSEQFLLEIVKKIEDRSQMGRFAHAVIFG